MSELILYTNPMSRGRTARWMVEEVAEAGGPVADVRLLDYQGQMQTPEFLAVNPMGKVPALVHEGTIVTECAAIVAYLAETFPETRMSPAVGSAARGPYLRWLFFASGPLEAAVIDARMGLSPTGPDQERMFGYGALSRVVEVLDALLSRQKTVTGEAFSAADLYLAAMMGWVMQFGLLEKRESFVSYVARATDRPAYHRASQKDDAAQG